jgi:hypothetical protein
LAKKLTIVVFMFSVFAFMIVGMKFIKDTGILRKFPAAEYLTEDEARLRPVYSQLSDKEKALYTAVYRGMMQKKGKIALPYEIGGSTYSKIYCLVEKQESELFFADSTYYTAEKLRDAKIIYRTEKESIDEMLSALRAEADIAVAGITAADDEYNKALKIHDQLVRECTYTLDDETPYRSTAYGCLVEKKANCEGYSKAFAYLAAKCGMKCLVVTGITDTGENHAWNQIMIDGDWYNVDVTWDDTDVPGDMRRLYFLGNDREFGRTHTAETEYFSPFECSGSGNGYFVRTGQMASSAEDAEMIVRKALTAGNNAVEVKFIGESGFEDFKHNYIDGGKIFDVVTDTIGVDGEIGLTVRQNDEELCFTLYFSGI